MEAQGIEVTLKAEQRVTARALERVELNLAIALRTMSPENRDIALQACHTPALT